MPEILNLLDTGANLVKELEEENRHLRQALSKVLGGLHVINANANTLVRWHDDPNCNIPVEAGKIMTDRLILHQLIVWYTRHGPRETVCDGHPPLHPGGHRQFCTRPER